MIEVSINKKLDGASGPMTLGCEFALKRGEVLTLYGASGSGKTSILKMLAGLMAPDQGKIMSGGYVWFDANTRTQVPTEKRQLRYVTQEYQLFPNMNVQENISFALQNAQNLIAVDDLLSIVQLQELKYARISTLSGGQRQRVAIAQALIHRTPLLLLDECFSAQDDALRDHLQQYILDWKKDTVIILVSHQVSGICKMSDQVLKLEDGRVVDRGTPEQVFGTNQSITAEVLSVVDGTRVRLLIGDQLVILEKRPSWADVKVGDKIQVKL